MKAIAGINDILLLVLSIIVLLIVVYQASGSPLIAERGLTAAEQMQFDNQKAEQLKALKGYYSSFMKTDGGLDSYEASVLIARAVEYTWRDCSQFCREEGDIPEFTMFFADHPIVLSKKLDCGNEYEYAEGEKYQISKNNIRGMCSDADLGVDKTERVDEWTVTAWGLKNSLCKNFIVEGKQWGNGDCANGYILDDSDNTNKKCKSFCATSGEHDFAREITSDRIKGWIGTMEFEKSYNNIKITYDPDCTYISGKVCKIWVAGGIICFFKQLKQSCSMVEIGKGADKSAFLTKTSATLAIDKASYKTGDTIKFSGILKDKDNKPLSGKEINLIKNVPKPGGKLTEFIEKEIGSATTGSDGKYEISYTVNCEGVTIFAKFEGEDKYMESKSSDISVFPEDMLTCISVCSSLMCGAENSVPCSCGGTLITGTKVWCGYTPKCSPGKGFSSQSECNAACI